MVLITGYEKVKPRASYSITVYFGNGILITPNREEDASKILELAKGLQNRDLNPEITVHLEYVSRDNPLERVEEETTIPNLEKIISGALEYPIKRFEQIDPDIHGADIGD